MESDSESDEDGDGDDKQVKILGISASPRGNDDPRGSRSEKLLKKTLDYVEKFGGKTKMIKLVEKRIFLCEGCYSRDPDECVFPCVHDDDTNDLLKEIILADGFVFSTPIYWGSSSSLLKILVEKMTAIENNREEIFREYSRDPLEGKPFVILASQDSEGASLALSQLVWSFNGMGLMLLPYGLIFEPNILERPLAKIGLRLMGVRKFEWIENTIRLAARNLVGVIRSLKYYGFDDHKVIEPKN